MAFLCYFIVLDLQQHVHDIQNIRRCSGTSLTGEPSSNVWVHPQGTNHCPLGLKQMVDPLDQRGFVLE
jgi:hypothetical protein